MSFQSIHHMIINEEDIIVSRFDLQFVIIALVAIKLSCPIFIMQQSLEEEGHIRCSGLVCSSVLSFFRHKEETPEKSCVYLIC
ncbi:hypothetical protein GDO81_025606 [Engystomops pustulosus]|uniref:Uncharacterized protein n=1 Tax=Engystomops pustulosus TaxID=76066 RepID=A0AAV6YPF0_ENGPU|nr:hypothetical protein GDO81_025606 [Engystomops pustulosus]